MNTKTKVAKVRAATKTIGTADVNASAMTTMLLGLQTKHFNRTASCKEVLLPLPYQKP